jgi:hypothetical protein
MIAVYGRTKNARENPGENAVHTSKRRVMPFTSVEWRALEDFRRFSES